MKLNGRGQTKTGAPIHPSKRGAGSRRSERSMHSVRSRGRRHRKRRLVRELGGSRQGNRHPWWFSPDDRDWLCSPDRSRRCVSLHMLVTAAEFLLGPRARHECPLGKLPPISARAAPLFLRLHSAVDPAETPSFGAFLAQCPSVTPGTKRLPGVPRGLATCLIGTQQPWLAPRNSGALVACRLQLTDSLAQRRTGICGKTLSAYVSVYLDSINTIDVYGEILLCKFGCRLGKLRLRENRRRFFRRRLKNWAGRSQRPSHPGPHPLGPIPSTSRGLMDRPVGIRERRRELRRWQQRGVHD